MKKYYKIIIVFLILILTGCQQTFEHNDVVYYENILCLPEEKEAIGAYREENVDISEVPKCSQFNFISDSYEGIWHTFFVRPLAWLLINIGTKVGSYGLAIILVTLLMRFLMFPITAKTAQQSENMKSAKPDLEELEKKYKNKEDKAEMMQKGKEQLQIYKKHNIQPLAGCMFAIVQIPLFFAFFQAINRVPVLFEENFLGIFVLKTTPLQAVSAGQWHYLIFIALIIISTHYSFKLNKASTGVGEQAIQMEKIMKFMIIFISFISFTLSVGIGLYWVFNSTFTILQNLIIKKRRERKVLQNV